jgi:hypothetical protein
MRPVAVRLRNNHDRAIAPSDNLFAGFEMQDTEISSDATIPWVLQLQAVSAQEPSRLIQFLTGAIQGCGGWVLSRGTNDDGTVNLLFEFERQACIDMYSVLIASGVELSQTGHIHFTELCQCTRSQQPARSNDIASVDLEIQTIPIETICCSAEPGIA